MTLKGEKIIFWVLAGVSLLLYIYAGITLKGEENNLAYINLYFISFLPFLSAILLFKNYAEDLSLPIIITGLLFRAVLVFTEPVTSDDQFRYLWEGKMILNGENPYAKSPADSSLEYLHEENLPSRVTYKQFTTIYPPIAHLIFAAGYFASGESTLGIKLLLLFFEACTLLLLLRLLRNRGMSGNYIILYAWLPLMMYEFFVNTHIDAFAVFFFILFIYMIQNKGNKILSGVLAGLTCAVKPYCVFAFPLIVKKEGIKNSLIIFITAGAVLGLVYLPFLNTERSVFSSFTKYMNNWEFNASVYRALKGITGVQTARFIVSVALGASILLVAWRSKDFYRTLVFSFILAISFGATNYPWYMVWLAAVSVLNPMPAVYWLFYGVNFTNFTPLGRIWIEYNWAILIEYSVFYVLLCYAFLNNKFMLIHFSNKKESSS